MEKEFITMYQGNEEIKVFNAFSNEQITVQVREDYKTGDGVLARIINHTNDEIGVKIKVHDEYFIDEYMIIQGDSEINIYHSGSIPALIDGDFLIVDNKAEIREMVGTHSKKE